MSEAPAKKQRTASVPLPKLQFKFDLPAELWVCCLQFAMYDLRDVSLATQVNTMFHDVIVGDNTKALDFVVAGLGINPTVSYCEHLVTHRMGLSLMYIDEVSEDPILQALSELSSLKMLQIRTCGATDTGVQVLSSLMSLTSLTLNFGDHVTDAGVRSLSVLTSLELLDLGGCKFVGNDLTPLRPLTSLKTLNLWCCLGVHDRCLHSLSSLTSLTSLSFGSCTLLTDEGVRFLSRSLTWLQNLNLGSLPNLTDAALLSLSSMTSLRSLDLVRNHNFTDAGVHALSRLQREDRGPTSRKEVGVGWLL